jgi:hypothetical protein
VEEGFKPSYDAMSNMCQALPHCCCVDWGAEDIVGRGTGGGCVVGTSFEMWRKITDGARQPCRKVTANKHSTQYRRMPYQ